MKTLALVVVAGLLFTSCGGGSSPSSPGGGGGTVHAAPGFTVANVSGGYAFGVAGSAGNFPVAGTGVATADGQGNITAGEETINVGGILCHGTFAGTYTVNPNGTGTVTLTGVLDAQSITNGCITIPTTSSLAIGNGGSTIIISSESPSAVRVATAVKQ